MRVLVLTSRDIYGAGGEASLMRAKGTALAAEGCTLGYVSCRWQLPPKSNDIDVIHAFSTWQWLLNPFGCYRQLCRLLKEWGPDVLVVSGQWLKFHPWIIGKLRANNPIIVSLDLQGALEEVSEYKLIKGLRFASQCFYKLLSTHEQRLVRHVDVIEVVSNNFKEYIKKKYPQFRGNIAVVPCGISKIFDDDEYERHRRHWRGRLGIGQTETVAVYAGGLSKWQRVGDVVSFASAHPSMRVFLMTAGDVRSLGGELPENVVVSSLPHHDLVTALCAFDYGFLLRYADMTNYVAFPNKASEYLNARLRIIIDSAQIGCVYPEFAQAFISLKDMRSEYPPPEKVRYPIEQLQYDHTVPELLQAYGRAMDGPFGNSAPSRVRRRKGSERYIGIP